jgi:hypothetical protein
MPTVSSYGGRKVATAALPGVRKTAAETPTSEGAGLAQAKAGTADALGRLGGTVAAVGIEGYRQSQAVKLDEQRKAEDVLLLARSNQIDSFVTRRLYTPKTGALALEGEATLGLSETVGQEYDTFVGDLGKGLSTERQRQAFARLTSDRRQRLDLTLEQHTFASMRTFTANELQSKINNMVDEAQRYATDPNRVGVALGEAVDAIKTFGPTLGLGPEQVKEQVGAVTSKTHVGVIEQLLAQDKSKAAHIYFEETKGQIHADAFARIEKALAEGSTRAEGQKAADAIIAAGGTLTQQREKARGIEDPDVRDNVMQRIEHENAINEKAQRDADEGLVGSAYATIYRTHNMNSLTPATIAALGPHLPGLRSFADRLARGLPTETDLPTYYAMMKQAVDEPKNFATLNLQGLIGKLDEGDFKHVVQVQMAIRGAKPQAADELLSGFRSISQIADDGLVSYGIDPKAKPTTPEGKAVAEYYRVIDRGVAALGIPAGKKPTNQDIQSIVDGILSRQTKTPGTWWAVLRPFTYDLADQNKRLIETTITDVPAEERPAIEDALKLMGRPVSDATVLDLYIDHKMRAR